MMQKSTSASARNDSAEKETASGLLLNHRDKKDEFFQRSAGTNQLHNVPLELKSLRQWVCFDLEEKDRNLKPKKVPKNPHNGFNASHSDPKTWGTFEEVIEACKKYGFSQVGFAFTENDPYTGIDIDNCISETGEFNDISKEMLELFKDTYTEYSISRKGLHIIVKGTIDKGRKNPKKGIEIYSSNRFFVMTGDVLQNGSILEMQATLNRIYIDLFPNTERTIKPSLRQSELTFSDQEIIKRASEAKNGSKFQALLNGDTALYQNDHSSADLAFCSLLAFWTPDKDQIDRIFRMSGLYREKWDRKDYKEQTIDKALSANTHSYQTHPLYCNNTVPINNHTSHLKEHTGCITEISSESDSKEAGRVKKFEFVPIGKMIQIPAKPNWLVKKYIDLGSLVVLFGEPESMKSFTIIDIGLSVATGQDWHGNPIGKQGPVLYIVGEGLAGISRRIFAWGLFHNIDLSNVRFFVSERAAQFLDENSAIEVENAVTQISKDYGSPVLVIIDTLNRNYGPGDENSAKDMTVFISRISRLISQHGCTVAVVHHTGIISQDRARGSCVLRGAADWEYRLKKNKNDSKTLSSTKVKDYDHPPDITFEPKIILLKDWNDDEGKEMTSCVLQLADKDVKSHKLKPLKPVSKKVLDALKQAIQASGEMCVHIDVWRETAYQHEISISTNSEAKKKAFQRAQKDLCELGCVVIESEYCWVKEDKGQIRDNCGTCPG